MVYMVCELLIRKVGLFELAIVVLLPLSMLLAVCHWQAPPPQEPTEEPLLCPFFCSAKQVRSAFPTSQRLISRDASSTIPCMSSGSSNLNASWTSTPALDMPVIRTTNLPKIVHSVFTFQLNDQTIVRELNDLDTSRVTLNVTCTTWYTEGDCTGIGSTPPRPQRVTERCIHASRPISSTVSVTVEEGLFVHVFRVTLRMSKIILNGAPRSFIVKNMMVTNYSGPDSTAAFKTKGGI